MVTLQEQFEKDFPDKSVREIRAYDKYEGSNFTNYDLDLREYTNLEILCFGDNKLTSIYLVQHEKNSICIDLSVNNLTSIDLSRCNNIKNLTIYDNKIQPTDIAIFSNFVNLVYLRIGTTSTGIIKGKHNKFYGSLKSYQNLTKLRTICIEATDVNEGLEYLPENLTLVKSDKNIFQNRGD